MENKNLILVNGYIRYKRKPIIENNEAQQVLNEIVKEENENKEAQDFLNEIEDYFNKLKPRII